MTYLQKLNSLILKLQQCKTNQTIATAENSIVALLHQCPQSQLIQSLNLLTQKMSEFNFRHVFKNLFNEIEFIFKYQTKLSSFLINNLIINPNDNNINPLSKNKRILLLQLMFNYPIEKDSQQKKTLTYVLRKTKCYNDLKFCYSLLLTVNETCMELNVEEIQKLDLNQIAKLVIQIIKSWSKAPDHLLDQALRFVNYTIIPDILTQYNHQSHQSQQLISQILNHVIGILQKNIHKIGNTYKFLSIYIKNHNIIGLEMKDQTFLKMISLCKVQIQAMFPNLQHLPINVLEVEIQKLQQHANNNKVGQHNKQQQQEMKDEQRDEELIINNNNNNTINESNMIESNMSIKILKGVSSFITQLFIFLCQQKQQQKQQQQNNKKLENKQNILQDSKSLRVFRKVFELLSFCNDKEIFANFIQVYIKRQQIQKVLKIELDITEEHLMTYIVRNCLTPWFGNGKQQSIKQIDQKNKQNQNRHQHKDSEQKYILQCIQVIIRKWVNQQQTKVTKILELIKHKIDRQYDQAFNTRQFQSACNILILVLRITHQQNESKLMEQQDHQSIQKDEQNNFSYKKTLSKDEIIEWIKALLNLNESCLPIHRKVIVSKTYQILSQVYSTILPGNQYLQQVIENELITKSYPQKKQHLQKLISFYQTQGDAIFEQGYRNKIQLKKFNQTVNLLFSRQDQHKIKHQLSQSKIQNQHQNQQQNQNKEAVISLIEDDTKQKRHLSNSKFRIYKLLDRLYKKLQLNSLQLKDRKHLWTLIIRVYKMNSQQDEIVNIRDIKKMFSSRADILLARHLVSEMVQQRQVKQILRLSKQQLQMIGNKFKQYPFYYENQLKAFNRIK